MVVDRHFAIVTSLDAPAHTHIVSVFEVTLHPENDHVLSTVPHARLPTERERNSATSEVSLAPFTLK